jgi:tetratricopeptide (TPR) repeat protein
MAIHSVCPACRAEYDLADHLGGKRVVCRQCQQAFDVPAADGLPHDAVTADVGAVRRPVVVRPPRRARYEEDDEDGPERLAPVRLLVGAVVGVVLLLLGGVVLAVYFMRAGPAPRPAEADQPAVKVLPAPRGGMRGPAVAMRGRARGAPPANAAAPQAPIDRGNALMDQGHFEEAVTAYREAVRQTPDSADAHSNLGLALGAAAFYTEALKECREAVRLQPDAAPVQFNLGQALLRQFQYKEAEAAFREAIRLQPGYPLAVCNLGLALQGQGRLDEALEQLRRGQALGGHVPGLPARSAAWVRQCERLIEVDRKLPAILAGDAQPDGAVEYVDVVNLCVVQKHLTAAAARFAARAPAADPQLTGGLRFACHYNGACGAALAAGGHGADAGHLPDKVAAMLRRQALGWLRTELAGQAQLAEREEPVRGGVRLQMRHWQQDPDLAAVRDPQALAALPEDEQPAWRQLWADVDALLKKAAPPQ